MIPFLVFNHYIEFGGKGIALQKFQPLQYINSNKVTHSIGFGDLAVLIMGKNQENFQCPSV